MIFDNYFLFSPDDRHGYRTGLMAMPLARKLRQVMVIREERWAFFGRTALFITPS